jgi:hypothetical protein
MHYHFGNENVRRIIEIFLKSKEKNEYKFYPITPSSHSGKANMIMIMNRQKLLTFSIKLLYWEVLPVQNSQRVKTNSTLRPQGYHGSSLLMFHGQHLNHSFAERQKGRQGMMKSICPEKLQASLANWRKDPTFQAFEERLEKTVKCPDEKTLLMAVLLSSGKTEALLGVLLYIGVTPAVQLLSRMANSTMGSVRTMFGREEIPEEHNELQQEA